jgi:alpha-D-xyloside xylohydrolase
MGAGSMRLPAALTLLLLAACTSKPATRATLQGDGFTAVVEAAPFSLTLVGADGGTLLTTSGGPRVTLDAHTYEAQLIPGWDGYRSHERPWRQALTGTLVKADAHSATLTLTDDTLAVTVTLEVDGTRLRYRHAVDDTRNFNKAALAFTLPGDSHFFGLGQRTATVDHLGQRLYSWPEEGGLGTGEDAGVAADNPYPNGPSMTYFPVPFVHTTHGVSVLVDTTRRSEAHLGSDVDAPGTWRLAVDDTQLALTFYVRPRPLDAIDDYTQDTGRPPVPAAWAYGPRRRINRGALVGGVPEWQAMRARRLPLTAVDDAMHSLPSNSQQGHEAELQAWTAVLHANGFKAMDYNNPYVSQSAAGSAADYAYGAEHHLFEMAPDGGSATSFFLSGGAQTISAVDLTNPEAVTWFQGLLQRSISLGYDGWMHDFGEYVARSSHFADGRTGLEVHNAFPVLSAKAAFDLFASQPQLEGHAFSRSGYTGSQAYVLETWGGDPEASFDNTEGLPAMLRGGLNLGMVGEPYWSTDIGGYKCLTDAPHDKEMLVRWYEMSALSPMMHDEDACSNPVNGDGVKARLWDDTETQDIYRMAASLHTRLAPYFRALALEAHAHGTPITRHPFLLYPGLPETWAVEDSFFVGPSLYGAPAVRRGLTSRHVWLPPGRFVEWTERSVHQGPGFVDVPAPLGRLPLFVLENQLVPLLDAEVQTLAPATEASVVTEASRAGVLDVVVALSPGGSASFTLADGSTLSATRLAGDQGNPGALQSVTGAELSACERCVLADQSGAVARVRLNGASASQSTEQWGDVQVRWNGTARRIRWEVLELP